ncbi:hypothetical protein HispidOSU_001210, partial [Sigmodon hispidus]
MSTPTTLTRKPRVSIRARWYINIRSFCLGFGCVDAQPDKCPDYLIPYVPEDRFQRAASICDLSSVEYFIVSGKYPVDKLDRRR